VVVNEAHRFHRVRRTVAVVSLGALAVLAVLAPGWGGVRCPAVIRGARTFALEPIEPGRYQWTLSDGSGAGAARIVRQRVVEFDRGDSVELRLAPTIRDGDRVRRGEALATVRSIHQSAELEGLRASRATLVARLELLNAGGRPEAVAEARRAAEVARAEHAAQRRELERVTALAELGLVSAVDVETAEARDTVLDLEAERALAAVDVAREPARPEEVAVVAAETAALDARIAELEQLAEQIAVTSPVDGVVHLRGDGGVVEVHDARVVYLAVAIPVADARRARVGSTVRFSPSCRGAGEHTGTLVELARATATAHGQPVVWASARLDNPEGTLRPGTTGLARLDLDSVHPARRIASALLGSEP
jgi:hypothetical protein